MFRIVWFTLILLIGVIFSAACTANQISPTPEANMPNPASAHCEQNGGKLDLRQDASGGVTGVCVFPDGSECDEWAFFRDECKAGNSLVTPDPTTFQKATEPAPTATTEFASDGWKIYRNTELGYSFHYPSDASISTADDPLKTLTILGPMTGSDNWPVIYFNHPGDREDYRPPEGVDLEKWLIDHNLLMVGDTQSKSEVRKPDVQIAGTTAIHTRFERSPQSFAYDKYYFARSQQLYVVVIFHAGDKEDWYLYNHFLESIQFEQ